MNVYIGSASVMKYLLLVFFKSKRLVAPSYGALYNGPVPATSCASKRFELAAKFGITFTRFG